MILDKTTKIALENYTENLRKEGRNDEAFHLESIIGLRHMHKGPNDNCAVCARNFRHQIHFGPLVDAERALKPRGGK